MAFALLVCHTVHRGRQRTKPNTAHSKVWCGRGRWPTHPRGRMADIYLDDDIVLEGDYENEFQEGSDVEERER